MKNKRKVGDKVYFILDEFYIAKGEIIEIKYTNFESSIETKNSVLYKIEYENKKIKWAPFVFDNTEKAKETIINKITIHKTKEKVNKSKKRKVGDTVYFIYNTFEIAAGKIEEIVSTKIETKEGINESTFYVINYKGNIYSFVDIYDSSEKAKDHIISKIKIAK